MPLLFKTRKLTLSIRDETITLYINDLDEKDAEHLDCCCESDADTNTDSIPQEVKDLAYALQATLDKAIYGGPTPLSQYSYGREHAVHDYYHNDEMSANVAHYHIVLNQRVDEALLLRFLNALKTDNHITPEESNSIMAKYRIAMMTIKFKADLIFTGDK